MGGHPNCIVSTGGIVPVSGEIPENSYIPPPRVRFSMSQRDIPTAKRSMGLELHEQEGGP